MKQSNCPNRKSGRKRAEDVENVDIVDRYKMLRILNKKYPHLFERNFPQKNVDVVDNYFFSRFSPIFTTSPAPIVINRSPLMQFFRMKS